MTTTTMRALGLLLLAGASASAEPSARPRLCPEDAPPGVRLPPRAGCRAPDAASRVPAGDGFVDLGNGTRLRMGGRVGADLDVRR